MNKIHKIKNTIYLLLLCAAALSYTSCGLKSQAEEDEEVIQDYLADKGLTTTRHESGLHYIIKKEGTGSNPSVSNTVIVHYKGFLTNGQQFDGTTTKPIEFPLYNLIPGWQIGIPLIKKGGEIQLIIPSGLGYGPRPTGSIPANSVLIFDIQLVDFK